MRAHRAGPSARSPGLSQIRHAHGEPNSNGRQRHGKSQAEHLPAFDGENRPVRRGSL